MQSLNGEIFLGAFAAKVENYTDWHRQAPSVRMQQLEHYRKKVYEIQYR